MSNLSLKSLIPAVKEAGIIGMEGQRGVASTYKNDGSILTEYDIRINTFLYEEISRLFPDANIITEEAEGLFDPDKPYTFAVDPIDGTDAYSQGMPGWAISIGLLDRSLTPVGGLIYAPAWNSPSENGTFIFSDRVGDVYINERPVDTRAESEEGVSLHQIMVSSRIHRDLDMKAFPGKMRNTGGAVLNIAVQLMYSRVIGTVVSPCHIWDLAAAHGIISNAGLNMEYFSGGEIDYHSMLRGENAEEYMLAGTAKGIDEIRSYISIAIPS